LASTGVFVAVVPNRGGRRGYQHDAAHAAAGAAPAAAGKTLCYAPVSSHDKDLVKSRVFSSRLSGSRSRKNLRALAA